MIWVYKIINRRTGKFYIGSTMDINNRIDRHFWQLRKGVHHSYLLQEAWTKDYRYFDYEIVEVFEDIKSGRDKEQEILNAEYDNLYNIGKFSSFGGDLTSYHPRKKEIVERRRLSQIEMLSNLTPEEKKARYGLPGELNPMYGGSHTEEVKERLSGFHKGNTYAKGYKWTPEQREKLSKIASQRIGEKNPFFGKEHTQETKEKIASANRGRKPKNSRKVIIEGKEYESVTESSRQLNVVPATIIHRIKSKNPKYAGYFYKD